MQFAIWLGNLLRGDLGKSFFFKRQVTELIGQRVGPTLALATRHHDHHRSLVAVPLGVLAAYRHGSWIDRLVMGFSVLGFSVPVFVLGYLLIYVFAIQIKLFPVQGYRSIADGFWPFLYRLILPSAHALGDLHRADRADHAGERARGAGRGLHPHRLRQGPDRAASC